MDKGLIKTGKLYFHCFSEGAGASVLEDLHRSYMDRSSFDEANPDPFLTVFAEGERAVVLKIMALMRLGSETPETGGEKDAVSGD